MKYIRCPKCGINYILPSQELCSVCSEASNGASREEQFDVCPYCHKNAIDYNQLMCNSCNNKRKHH